MNYKKQHIYLVGIILSLLCFPKLEAQNSGYFWSDDTTMLEAGTYLYLPPLDTLIATAIRNNPRIKFLDKDVDISEREIGKMRKDWTNHIFLETGASYGYWGVYGLDNLYKSVQTTEDQIQFARDDYRYYVGASVKLPLDFILKHKAKVEQARIGMERDIYEKQFAATEIAREVIVQYNAVKFANATMNIRVRDLQQTTINLDKAMREFEEGIMDMNELTDIRYQHGQTQAYYEKSKYELRLAYNLLENTVGQPLN